MRQQKNNFTTMDFSDFKSTVRVLINPDYLISKSLVGVQTSTKTHSQEQNAEHFNEPDDSFYQQKFLWNIDNSYMSANILKVVEPKLKIKKTVKVIRLISGRKAARSLNFNIKSESVEIGESCTKDSRKTAGFPKFISKRKLNTCD